MNHSLPQEKIAKSEKHHVTQLVLALTILKRHIRVYAINHNIIAENLKNAFDSLQKILSVKPFLTIGIAHDVLLLKDDILDERSPFIKEFAELLNSFGIISITFRRGITKDELLRLLNVLSTNPNILLKQRDLKSLLFLNRITHIELQSLDLNYLRITEEKEIAPETIKDKGKSRKEWRSLINAIVSFDADIKSPMSVVRQQDFSDSATPQLKRSEDTIKGRNIIRNYESTIAHYPHASRETDKTELDEVVSTVHDLINGLHPQLKANLLSAAERAITSLPISTIESEDFKCFKIDMVTEILRSALHNKRQISPSLVCLFQKLSAINEEHTRDSKNKVSGIMTLSDESLIKENEIESLIEREQYEKYIPVDYGNTLVQRTVASPALLDEDFEKVLIENYSMALEDKSLMFRTNQMLLSLLDEDICEDDYHDFSGELTATVPEYLSLAQFQFPIKLLETFRRHEKEKPSPTIRDRARQCMGKILDRHNISKALSPFILQGLDMPSLKEFLLACESPIITWLLDVYSQAETPQSQKVISEALILFGRTAIDEILKILPELTEKRLQNMLALLRMLDDNSVVSRIKEYMQHPSVDVRMEAIVTLLKFNDADAAVNLEKAVCSKDRYEASRAIVISCRNRRLNIIEKLPSRIKTFLILKNDQILNEIIINEVVNTKQHEVMSRLVKVAGVKWTLSPIKLAMTKKALFELLDQFPRPHRDQLISIGLQSRNKRIKALCIESVQE